MVDYMGHNGQYSFHTGSVKCKIIIFIDIYNYRPINSYINVALSSGPVLSGVRGINMAVRIPTVKLKIPGKLFFKVGSRTSVTFKL